MWYGYCNYNFSLAHLVMKEQTYVSAQNCTTPTNSVFN